MHDRLKCSLRTLWRRKVEYADNRRCFVELSFYRQEPNPLVEILWVFYSLFSLNQEYTKYITLLLKLILTEAKDIDI